ncbi:hypothetical protein PENSPDRAFT_660136 [Peniophora sp. CONT]|nr:hypothetical protein PENSPDRAFT_660136 [Peniophora sp. CONT]
MNRGDTPSPPLFYTDGPLVDRNNIEVPTSRYRLRRGRGAGRSWFQDGSSEQALRPANVVRPSNPTASHVSHRLDLSTAQDHDTVEISSREALSTWRNASTTLAQPLLAQPVPCILDAFSRALAVYRQVQLGGFALDVTTYDFTHRDELSGARTQEDPGIVLLRIKKEWQCSTTVLLAVAAIDTILFSYPLDEFAGTRYGMVLSSSSAALGLVINACLQYLYADFVRSVEVHLFIQSSNSYLLNHEPQIVHNIQSSCFPVTARLPLLCMLASLTGLSASLILMAYSVSPNMVLAICIATMVLFNLEYIIRMTQMIWRNLLSLAPTSYAHHERR